MATEKSPDPQSATPAATSRDLYFRLLGYIRPYWRMFGLSILGLIVLALTEPALAAMMKPLMDGSFGSQDPDHIRIVPIAIVGLFVVRGVSQYIASVALAWVSQRLVTDLRQAMFERILALPSRFFDATATGNLLSKINFDVNQVAGAVTSALMVLVRDSLTIIGLLALMFYLNWQLALFALTSAPAIAYIVAKISRRLRTSSRSLQNAMGDMTHVMEEGITGQRVVKVFGGEGYEKKRFHHASEQVRRFSMKFIQASALNTPLVQIVSSISIAAIVYFALLQSVDGNITIGGFSAFVIAMAMLLSPTKRLTSINEHLQKGLAAAESIFKLIDEPDERDSGTQSLQRAQGKLHFDKVSLNYRDNETVHDAQNEDTEKASTEHALQDINLTIEPGETVALVGRSGSGKTSLIHLIPRFYCPSSGRIQLDGIDLTDIKLGDLRQQIALVNQDVVLFNDSIANNIAYGPLTKASRTDIEAAAQAAHAMEFINDLPEGLDTKIGERGARLSGGQRQRLAIARAFLKDAPVLILDEATSALDTDSEKQVQLALEELTQGRTTLIIAHRLSTIEKADRIVVMDQGRIVETGSHQTLLQQNGIYQQLYRVQFSATSDHDADHDADQSADSSDE